MAILDITLRVPATGVARVIVAGEIDMSARDTLLAAVTGVVLAEDVQVIELDFTRVPLLDAAGIGTLLTIRNAAADRGKTVRVSGAVGLTRRVMEIAGVAEVLGVKHVT